MSQETIIFSMERVSKTVPPQKQILKNIYLSFFYGAKIGVLGLNGSGKSSLLRSLQVKTKAIRVILCSLRDILWECWNKNQNLTRLKR